MGVQCFWLECTDRAALWLRRYARTSDRGPCPAMPGQYSYHNARVRVEDGQLRKDDNDYLAAQPTRPYDNDPRWPAACECGYVFAADDPEQVFQSAIYRAETGEAKPLEEWGPGAMWNAWWMKPFIKSDGRCLVVKLPNGREWTIDSRASNCTRPTDDHDCWCRHGDPPNLTVDKTPEPGRSTCDAGGGSILAGEGADEYHGFLQGGVFT